jgi:maltose alpha-D-glucosyltransferase / alpha-amylase
LLPFYPSPLRDDGYDIADYTNVSPNYGRLADFREFLHSAHRRDIKVITELVINHTSDRHPWFQRARRAPRGTPERDFYVWSDTSEKFRGARVIFQDFEASNWAWDPVAKAYYWHRFYAHQPDLNFDNPAVWEAIFPVVDFWFEMGVDGMRLDAVPYLYEREGTNCENLPETHEFLRALRSHVDSKFPHRMFLAEANQWPEDAVIYFGAGDECHMAFHFPLMPRLFMALHQEDRFPILDILAQTPAIPDNCQWCLFLRNHDELTLEMVSDEGRDYMYRAYAADRTARINLGIRHRLAPLLNNNRRRIELMNALLFSLPGAPVIYYGDEIGMGDNIYLGDRNGVRTPMQWSPDRNAGFSRANPQKLYLPVIIDPEYHYEAVNVESQQKNPSSLLWWMKRLIALRKRHKAFSRGSIEFLNSDNPKIIAFVRRHEEERILVVANLSRFVQHGELDLREFRGLVPEELFGHNLFPPIGELPYLLTFGPHGFYWFSLKAPQRGERGDPGSREEHELATLDVPDHWAHWLFHEQSERLEGLLPDYLRQHQPPGQSPIAWAQIQQVFPHLVHHPEVYWLVVRLRFQSGISERALLPLTLIAEEEASQLLDPIAMAAIARLTGARRGLLCNALAVPLCGQSLVEAIRAGQTHWFAMGELAAVPLRRLRELSEPPGLETPTLLMRSERFNTVLVFGDRFILKTFRRIEEGVNPDLEISSFLSSEQDCGVVPPLLGYIEFRPREAPPITLAVLHQYVANQGTAWQLTLDYLSRFFERVAALSGERPPKAPTTRDPQQAGTAPLISMPPKALPELPTTPDPQQAGTASPISITPKGLPELPTDRDPQQVQTEAALGELIGGYAVTARRLGEQTALLHRALASDGGNPSFTPEPFGRHQQRSLYQSMRNLTHQVFTRLAHQCARLPAHIQELAKDLLALREPLLQRFLGVTKRPLGGSRIRTHGDYHLGQLLWTGNDFIVIDFEGNPEQSLGERQIKQSPLSDVAAMLRSFDYAAHSVLFGMANQRGRAPGIIRSEDRAALEPWARLWYEQASREFMKAYYEQIESAALLPPVPSERQILLDVFLLEKALDEIAGEMTRRPEWLTIPLRALLRMLRASDTEPVQ